LIRQGLSKKSGPPEQRDRDEVELTSAATSSEVKA
jgi:hypothetical protein